MLTLFMLIFLLINQSCSDIKELNTVKWSEFGLQNVCPLEEFFMQFDSIKNEFKRCIDFKHILYDIISPDHLINIDPNDLDEIEEEREIQKNFAAITYSKHRMLNPFCKLSKHWNNCIKYILPLHCLEPKAKSLVPIFLPRTVQEQLRKVYEKHAKELRMKQLSNSWEKYFYSDNHEVLQYEEKLRKEYFAQIRHLKFEQLTDYFKFRCDQRAELNIDSLDLIKEEQLTDDRFSSIDRFQQKTFSDLFQRTF